jgi:hypothetical protein
VIKPKLADAFLAVIVIVGIFLEKQIASYRAMLSIQAVRE